MKIVLVRVTGRRSAEEDPALAPADRQRASLRPAVSQRSGQSGVGVLRRSGHRALADAEWGSPSGAMNGPTTFVWLTAQTGPQSGTVITRR